MGILAHHEPIVALLNPGLMKVETGGETRVFASGEGFVQIRHNRATVIVEFADTAEDIKRDVVQRELAEAERAVQDSATEEARRRHAVAVKAAQARLALLDSGADRGCLRRPEEWAVGRRIGDPRGTG